MTGPADHPLPPPPPDWEPPRKERGSGRKIAAIAIVAILLLAAVMILPVGRMLLEGLTGRNYSASSEFTLTREMRIDVVTGQIEYTCDIPAPRDSSNGDGYIQDVVSISYSGSPSTSPKFGWDWLQWEGAEDGTAAITVEYEVRARTVIWDIGAGESGMVSDIPSEIAETQGGDEWELLDEDGEPTGEYKIWPGHPAIAGLADDLTDEDLTVYENAEEIYNYMRDNFKYGTVPDAEPKPCIQTLSDLEGDCDDQSILLISLLRAAGIPSWLAFGVLYDAGSGDWGAHAWVELYMPLSDGTGGSVVIDVVNGEFLVRNCNRMEEWKGDGNGQHLADYYNTLTYNYTLSNPHQQPPVVQFDDSCSGEYTASAEKIYSWILDLDAGTLIGSAPRKVF